MFVKGPYFIPLLGFHLLLGNSGTAVDLPAEHYDLGSSKVSELNIFRELLEQCWVKGCCEQCVGTICSTICDTKGQFGPSQVMIPQLEDRLWKTPEEWVARWLPLANRINCSLDLAAVHYQRPLKQQDPCTGLAFLMLAK